MTQLGLGKIVLIVCPIGVVVGGVSIGEAIQHEGVHGHSPIRGRRVEGVVLPYSPVVEWIRGCLISIKIIQRFPCIVTKGEGCRAQEEDQGASTQRAASSHGRRSTRECCLTQRVKYQAFV